MKAFPSAFIIMFLVVMVAKRGSFQDLNKEIKDAKISSLEKIILAQFIKDVKTMLSEKKGKEQTKKPYIRYNKLLLKKRNSQALNF